MIPPQEQLDKKTLALEDTQELRQTEQRSYDRKLTSVTAEYERKMNGLINHTGMSGLLHAAIERSENGNNAAQARAAPPGDGTAGPPMSERSGSVEPGRRGGGGGGGGGDTTQDAMAKVLHERWLSEREKAKALETRLKESEARMGDLEEVSGALLRMLCVVGFDVNGAGSQSSTMWTERKMDAGLHCFVFFWHASVKQTEVGVVG